MKRKIVGVILAPAYIRTCQDIRNEEAAGEIRNRMQEGAARHLAAPPLIDA